MTVIVYVLPFVDPSRKRVRVQPRRDAPALAAAKANEARLGSPVVGGHRGEDGLEHRRQRHSVEAKKQTSEAPSLRDPPTRGAQRCSEKGELRASARSVHGDLRCRRRSRGSESGSDRLDCAAVRHSRSDPPLRR